MNKTKKTLDLRSESKLSPTDSVLYNQIAIAIRQEFITFIKELSIPNKSSLDWWVEAPASRHLGRSFLFHYCCAFVLLKNLLDQTETIDSILVDSKAFKIILQQYLKSVKKEIQIVLLNQPLRRIIKNYLTFIYIITLYIFRHFIYYWVYNKKKKSFSKPIVLIDTYLTPNFISIFRSYPGLWESLSQEDRELVYFVPTLVSFSIKEYISKCKKLKESSKNYLLKDDYLLFMDYLWVFGHFVRTLRLKVNNIKFDGVDFSGLVREELYSFRGADLAIIGLLNFRFTFRLRQKKVPIRLVVDWFENQAVDKGWNAGFRKFYPKSEIIGYQGFVVFPHYLSFYPTEFEHHCGLLPSTISVIGKGHIDQKKEFFNDIDVNTAPAFRFQGVWEKRKHYPESSYCSILIALPIFLKESDEILRLVVTSLEETINKNIRVMIKIHPTNSHKIIQKVIGEHCPPYFEFVTGNFNECVERSNVLISNASSVCLETLAKGIPVIVVGSECGLTHNPIPEKITEDIWRLCYTPKEISEAIQFYANLDENETKRHEYIGNKICADYFEPVTRESVRLFLNLPTLEV